MRRTDMHGSHGHRWRWTSQTLSWMLLTVAVASCVLALRVWFDYGSGNDALEREEVSRLAGIAALGAVPCIALATAAIRLVRGRPRYAYVAAGAAWVAALVSPAPLVAISQQHPLGTTVALAVCAWGVAVSVLAVREGWSLSA